MKLNIKFVLAFFGLSLLFFASLFILFPNGELFEYIHKHLIRTIIVAGVIWMVCGALVIYFSYRITRSIRKIDDTVKILLNDETENIKKFLPTGKDEIAKLSESLNHHHQNIRLVYNIAFTIVKGKYNVQITTDSSNVLGNVLSELKEKLMIAKQERKYVEQESIRTEWYRQGVSDFSDLLQQNYQDPQKLAQDAIRKIVKHMKVEQGGIFIVEQRDGKELLVLTSAFAYDKIKLLNSEMEIGESLPGKCAEERKVIYINDLPEGYTFIGSGLGENSPKSLLLAPMIYENKLFGVIEIASFKEIEDYKLNFIQVVAERMAFELLNIQSKMLTIKMAEDFKKQAEEMTNQEKGLIKQIEVLESESKALKSNDFKNEEALHVFNEHVIRIDFDTKGKFLYSNRLSVELQDLTQSSNPDLENFLNNETVDHFIERLEEMKEISDFNEGQSEIRRFYALFNENKKIEKVILFIVALSNIDRPFNE